MPPPQMWIYNDFVEERKWKATKSRALVRAAEKHAEVRKSRKLTEAKVCGCVCIIMRACVCGRS